MHFTYIEGPQVVVDAALLRGVPDGIVVAGYSGTGGPLLRAIRHCLPDVPILGSDGLASNPAVFFRSIGPFRGPLHLAFFWDLATSGSCSEGFPEWMRSDSTMLVTGVEGLIHDAVAAVAEAVRAGRTRPVEIERYLRSLGRSGTSLDGATGQTVFGGERSAVEERVRRTEPSPPRTPGERE